jgi:hypothetical protein
LTFGLGIIILQGVSRRKSLAGVNIMTIWGLTERVSDGRFLHKTVSVMMIFYDFKKMLYCREKLDDFWHQMILKLTSNQSEQERKPSFL